MEFTAHDLRSVRYRMNWTQVEMAQVLGCSVKDLRDWEHGVCACQLNPHIRAKLLIFESQADSNSALTRRRAVADSLMAARGLSQIVDGEVIACLQDSQLAQLNLL